MLCLLFFTLIWEEFLTHPLTGFSRLFKIIWPKKKPEHTWMLDTETLTLLGAFYTSIQKGCTTVINQKLECINSKLQWAPSAWRLCMPQTQATLLVFSLSQQKTGRDSSLYNKISTLRLSHHVSLLVVSIGKVVFSSAKKPFAFFTRVAIVIPNTRLGWASAAEMFHSGVRGITSPAWMSSYCRVLGCGSYKRWVSCQGWTFQCFPVSSKIHREWTTWCLWRRCAAMECLRCSPTEPRFGFTMTSRVKKVNWNTEY